MQRRKRVAIALSLAGCLLGLAGCGGGGGNGGGAGEHTPAGRRTTATGLATTSRPKAGAYCLRPADHARSTYFGTGGRLGGYVMGSGPSLVVLAHQSGGDSCQMVGMARQLAAAGFRTLAFDFAGNASSAVMPPHYRLSDDVIAAVRYARRIGARNVALLGASMGGYAVLDAARRLQRSIVGVVALSAPRSFMYGPLELDIGSARTPVLLYAGRFDAAFASDARSLAAEDPSAELHILPTGDHGVELLTRPVVGHIIDWLRSHSGR